ncbi:hypothetical protein QY895_04965 [Latilactobacillus sakei]
MEALQEAEQLSKTSENLMVYAPQITTTQAALTQIKADAKTLNWQAWRQQLTDARARTC